MVKRKLRKGTHGYVNIQVPDVMRQVLGWHSGDNVDIKIDGDKLIIEKLGVSRYGEKNSINNEEVIPVVES